jgi:telomere resolvase
MAKVWLQERWKLLIPALVALDLSQEEEIERICQEEIVAWRARSGMNKDSSLRTPMTDTRNELRRVTKSTLNEKNTWFDPQDGENVHISLKYMNFSEDKWREMNMPSEEALQKRKENQQLVENPTAIVERAEKLLQSDRWYDLVAGLAVVTGRRLAEILKVGRFTLQTQYTVIFEGQLKRRDLDLKPFEIPTLVPAEEVIRAWRKLRTLVDCTDLTIAQVAEKYHKDPIVSANQYFTGLIPPKFGKKDLDTHSSRSVYAHIAVLWFDPIRVQDLHYVATVLGHYQARNEQDWTYFAATEHYFDYILGDGQGQVDGRRGIRLGEPGVQVLQVFKKEQSMIEEKTEGTTEETERQEPEVSSESRLETKPKKSRGALTTRPGTFDIVVGDMHARGFHKHDEIIVDYIGHDRTAHQMYEILSPMGQELGAETPVAILKALVDAYRAGGSSPDNQAIGALLSDITDEDLKGKETRVEYLKRLIAHDRKFKQAIENRHAGVDYVNLPFSQLEGIKTEKAALERFRRAVDAIIAHNEKQTDALHCWFVDAASVRKLVGGRNDMVQDYLRERGEELAAHHAKFKLDQKQNRKNVDIKEDVTIPVGDPAYTQIESEE